MKATVNLNQILQGGLAGLVAWLFKTVRTSWTFTSALLGLLGPLQLLGFPVFCVYNC